MTTFLSIWGLFGVYNFVRVFWGCLTAFLVYTPASFVIVLFIFTVVGPFAHVFVCWIREEVANECGTRNALD